MRPRLDEGGTFGCAWTTLLSLPVSRSHMIFFSSGRPQQEGLGNQDRGGPACATSESMGDDLSNSHGSPREGKEGVEGDDIGDRLGGVAALSWSNHPTIGERGLERDPVIETMFSSRCKIFSWLLVAAVLTTVQAEQNKSVETAKRLV
jgi:hypothetical protein